MQALGRWATLVCILALAGAAQAATFTVTNTADSDPGSLRQAISDANAAAGSDRIEFVIPGAGPFDIVPATPLPAITEEVVLDGTTQGGFAGTPLIRLVGPGGGASAGLMVQAPQVEIIALQFLGWDAANVGSGIEFTIGADNGLVRGCRIGLRDDNLVDPNVNGVTVAANNVVVGGLPGNGNIITGNTVGVRATGDNTRLGANSIGNASSVGRNTIGVWLQDSAGAVVGAGPGASSNTFLGNTEYGLLITGIDASGNLVLGNQFGFDPAAPADSGLVGIDLQKRRS